jgi:hypothetical protein
MKTLKIMGIIGIVWFSIHLCAIELAAYYVSPADFLIALYGIALSIVMVVQANRFIRKHKKTI